MRWGASGPPYLLIFPSPEFFGIPESPSTLGLSVPSLQSESTMTSLRAQGDSGLGTVVGWGKLGCRQGSHSNCFLTAKVTQGRDLVTSGGGADSGPG